MSLSLYRRAQLINAKVYDEKISALTSLRASVEGLRIQSLGVLAMEKLMLEISIKMINICRDIDEAKIEKNLKLVQKLENELGKLVYKTMEDCPF